MKTQSTAPTGQPQNFDVHETFFSTTDRRGVITAGNLVFSRISGYPVEQMIGEPHNLIRHPEMPRQVFRQLWDTIRGGRSFMGYVKNQAKNGNHYWVFAVVVPIPEGYLSVRIKPTSPLLDAVGDLYRRMIAAETEVTAAGQSEGQAAEASRELLQAAIRELGFPSYDAFSHHALNTEIKSRDAAIASRRLRLFPEQLPGGGATDFHRRLRALFAETREAYAGVNGLFASLDAFIEISRGIRERQAALRTISEEFRLNALNAHIAAHPLGAEGVTLGTVAQILNAHGQHLSRTSAILTDAIIGITTALADTTSNLSAARIEVEMLLSFLAEIAEGDVDGAQGDRLRSMAEDLRVGFLATVTHAFRALQAIEQRLPDVLATKEQLRKDIVYLQVAQISGLVEVSRLTGATSLYATFIGLRDQIDRGRRELDELDGIVEQLKAATEATPPLVRAIEQSMNHIHHELTTDAHDSAAEAPSVEWSPGGGVLRPVS